MKLKYGVVVAVLVFLFTGACYAEGAELCKENGGAVYNVPGKSIGQVIAGKKVVENIVSVKNSIQEVNSELLQKQLNKKEARAPIVETIDGRVVSLTAFSVDGKTSDKYVFDGIGRLDYTLHYDVEKGDKNDAHAPLVKYEDSKIQSLTVFTAKWNPAVQYAFDDGVLAEESVWNIQKGDKNDAHAPLVDFKGDEILSLTIFANKGQLSEKYIFDKGMLVEEIIFDGQGKVKDVPMDTRSNPGPEQANPVNILDLQKLRPINHADSVANAAISMRVTVTKSEENIDVANVAAKNNAKVKAHEANDQTMKRRISERRKDMLKALEGSEDKENK
ncbi:MAG: hypothetical protein NTY34_02490 [Candidatus Omnitrophica bacterium]|nr:hypothetical protein [Candidatus Omnitrophota bacterium]